MLRRRDVKDARIERAQRERTWVTTKPGSPTPAIFREVSPAGLEPAIVAFVGRCLLQFGYGDKRVNTLLAALATCRCGENEGRTHKASSCSPGFESGAVAIFRLVSPGHGARERSSRSDHVEFREGRWKSDGRTMGGRTLEYLQGGASSRSRTTMRRPVGREPGSTSPSRPRQHHLHMSDYGH